MVAGTQNVLQPLDRHTFLDDIAVVCYHYLQFQLVILCHMCLCQISKLHFHSQIKNLYVHNTPVYALLESFIAYHILWDKSLANTN